MTDVLTLHRPRTLAMAEHPAPPLVVTYAEAARLLGLSYSSIQRLVYAGRLDRVQLGGARAVRITTASIERYLAEEADRQRDLRGG